MLSVMRRSTSESAIIRAIALFSYSDLSKMPALPDKAHVMRKQPKQRRATATVDAIVGAAARILVESGYASASTNRIAARAGVGIGSLYEYFPGKAAIFAELRRREMERWYAKLRSWPGTGSPREAIRHIVSTRVRYAAENPRLYVALETEVPHAATAAVQGAIQDDFLTLSTGTSSAIASFYAPRRQSRSSRNS